MNNSHKHTSVVLIGRGLRRADRMIETLVILGTDLFFADDAEQGLALMNRERPDLVMCYADLCEAEVAALFRVVRSNRILSRIPMVFAGGSTTDIDRIVRVMDVGANDLVSQHFNADAFIARLVRLMQQRSHETARRREYEALRRDQMRSLDIVRETTALFRSFDREGEFLSGSASAEERLEVGLRMIAGLANILEDQMNAVDGWFASGEVLPARRPARDRELSLAA